jgi:DNA-binding XRE family transcriptional regulator
LRRDALRSLPRVTAVAVTAPRPVRIVRRVIEGIPSATARTAVVFGIVHSSRLCYSHCDGDKCTTQELIVVTSAQIRAARGLLNWTVRDLADKSGVHRNTVTRIETEATTPGHSIAAVQAALEAAGVEFIPENGGGAGVRLRKA